MTSKEKCPQRNDSGRMARNLFCTTRDVRIKMDFLFPWATGWNTGGSIPGTEWRFSSPYPPDRLWGPTQPVPGVKHKADHSLRPSVQVKNAWSYISTSPYISVEWCLFKHHGQLYLHLLPITQRARYLELNTVSLPSPSDPLYVFCSERMNLIVKSHLSVCLFLSVVHPSVCMLPVRVPDYLNFRIRVSTKVQINLYGLSCPKATTSKPRYLFEQNSHHEKSLRFVEPLWFLLIMLIIYGSSGFD
jgi:hypothetical protein